MSDTSDPTLTPPPAPPTPPPLPNDAAARSPTGEILEPSQIPPKTPETPKPGEAPAPTSTSKDGDKPAPAVPEAYDFKAPEGYTLDTKLIEEVTPVFKELGLTQDQAQRLVEFHSKAMIEAAKAPASTYETMRRDWLATVDADPEIRAATADGKTGTEAVKIGISKTLAALGDPKLTADFKAAMDLTGAGDNPAFIKAMWKLSAFVTEGKHVPGTGPSVHGQTPPGAPAKPSPAQALYPNLR